MCAIAGYVGNLNRDKLILMLDSMSHRGPDDRGTYIKDSLGLGHNRLSIIELTKLGHQPMFDDAKSIAIVFNGEIYNYQELKRELEKSFHFKSQSDTEVIIYAYKKWGINCLERLNGMFSFVIYDLKQNLLFGARDRLGEKPLKYLLKDDLFAFASEVKALVKVNPDGPEIDYEAISDYLTLQYVPSPKTGFKDIYKLPPGHYFIYKNKKLRIQKYWDIDYSKKINLSDNDWEDLLEENINKAVKDRLVSDVPLGAFLSGGVDSSSVVAFMARNSSRPINTFSVGFNDPKYDESSYAKIVSKLYGTKHSLVKVEVKDFKETFTKVPDYYDEPIADNSTTPTMFLSNFSRKKIKVALSGDGGDENFAGYERYNIVDFGRIYKNIPKTVRDLLIRPTANLFSSVFPGTLTNRIKIYTSTFNQPFYQRYLNYSLFFNNKEKENIYSNNFARETRGKNTLLMYKDIFNKGINNIDNALFFDIKSYLPEDLMYKIDMASMSCGLEVRAPLLDYKLMELTAQIPASKKIKFFNKKYIFKKMLIDKNILPEEIVNRPKKGFILPIKHWLKNELKEYVISELGSQKFRQMGVFENKKLDKYLENYFASKIDYSNNIFSLLALARWINKYF